MTVEPSIRNASLSDAARIAEIYSHYVASTAITFEYEPPTSQEMANRIKSIQRSYPYLVAELDGEIMGFAYASFFKARPAYDRSVEVSIYLDKDARGSGLGRKLYDALEAYLGNMGILNLYACIAKPISLNDPHLSDASIRFHEKCGYSLIGTFHKCGYKFDTWYDMVFMEKFIGEHAPDPRHPSIPLLK